MIEVLYIRLHNVRKRPTSTRYSLFLLQFSFLHLIVHPTLFIKFLQRNKYKTLHHLLYRLNERRRYIVNANRYKVNANRRDKVWRNVALSHGRRLKGTVEKINGVASFNLLYLYSFIKKQILNLTSFTL
jgi:hypothetical protein